MKILVTGGSGVIGAAVIPELLRAGHNVRLLSRGADHDAHDYPSSVEPFPADIGNPDTLAGAADGCGAILHIAGIAHEQPPEITFESVNVGGTRHLLAAARQANLPRFLYLSSLGADRGESAYQKSKHQAEELVRDYAGPWLILRPGAVYGPGDETISMLLKMVRTLPAVPVVAEGEQPFQPIWYRDLGRALVTALARPELDRTVLELAGPDITTTTDLLNRLSTITGRTPPRLEVPTWLTRFGASALEAFGGLGARLLEQTQVGTPITTAKLQMLLEGNVIQDDRQNALLTTFAQRGTSLQDGLEQLADLLPELTPGQGVGAFEAATYSADISQSSLTPAAVINLVCDRLGEIMPLEFAAEPGTEVDVREGHTLTATLPVRGNIQIRVQERTDTSVTFVTLSGHPLAGVLTFSAEPSPGGVRFRVRTVTQAANLLDWLSMQMGGGVLQAQNWREVVRRVVAAAGGPAAVEVKRESRILDQAEAKAVQEQTEQLVQERRRREMDQDSVTTRRDAGA